MRALVNIPLVLGALVLAVPAHADDTFEAKATGAQQLGRVESLVWAFTTPCDSGDDTQQRQCRRVRDTRAAELAGATLLVDADKDAFDVGAWSPQKKSVPMTLSSCIRCSGVEIDGKTYYVVTSRDGGAAPKLKGGKLETALLHDNARQFADEAAAKAFAKSVSNARVQLLVKVPAKPKTVVDGKPVVVLDLIGYRVFSPCDGSIVFANPKSGPAEADKKQCGPIASGAASGNDVAQLTPALINDAMKPVVEAANACFAKFAVAGKAKLKITIAADGSVTKYDQQGDFVSTPTGQCIDAAMTKAAFPRSKKAKTSISFPINLQ
ncbi:MAG TPA: hypothetical protein VIV40_22890 [Kofleriaceae bacterium]